MTELDKQYKLFHELTAQALHDILALRQAVFVVEQNCPYQDADNYDSVATHVLCYQKSDSENLLASYLRILPPNTQHEGACAIGRVVTQTHFRGQGLASVLLTEAVAYCQEAYQNTPIKLSAQAHLTKFYEGFGFTASGALYMEDGILHQGMIIT